MKARAWLFGFLRPHRAAIAAVLSVSLVATLVALAQPYITKFLIDDGLIAGDLGLVLALCGLMLLVALAAAALSGLNRWLYVRTSGRILFAIREHVFAHLLGLSPLWHARVGGGDVMARLDGDVAEIQRFALDSLLGLVTGVIGLVGAVALMVSLSPGLSLLAFILLPLQVLFLLRMRPLVERRTRAVRERTGQVTGFFYDTLRQIKFIQSMAGEARESARLNGLNRAYLADTLRLQMASFLASTGPSLLTVTATIMVFAAGGAMVIDGDLTVGTLIAFSAYMARSSGPLQGLLGLYVAVQRARVSLERVRELIDVEPEVRAPDVPRAPPPGAPGEVRFVGLRHRYEPDGPVVLDGLDLTIPGGGKIGIMGASGVGKTTLIDLLHRHFDPQEGCILLDGVDLRDMDPKELRRRVAVVAQDAAIVAGTVAENIAYARPDAAMEDIKAAARAARIASDIEALPEGYDTLLGAGGETLSGGQRQRISVARALLMKPSVLVLDEAVSAVDRETTAAIVAEVEALFGDRTMIIISHHLDSLEGVDRIVHLVDGKLRGDGAG